MAVTSDGPGATQALLEAPLVLPTRNKMSKYSQASSLSITFSPRSVPIRSYSWTEKALCWEELDQTIM